MSDTIKFDKTLSCGLRMCIVKMNGTERDGQFLWSLAKNGQVLSCFYDTDIGIAYQRMLLAASGILECSTKELNTLRASEVPT